MKPKRKFVYVERRIDRHGVERVYGYDSDGKKFFVNMEEVVKIYASRGIDELKRVV